MYESDLLEIVVCFIDGYGSVNIEFVTFCIYNGIINYKNFVKMIFFPTQILFNE